MTLLSIRAFSAIAIVFAPLALNAERFESETLRADFSSFSEEGEVSHDKMLVSIHDRTTDSVLELRGSTMHTTGNDGLTPSHFVGYDFVDDQGFRWVFCQQEAQGWVEVIDRSGVVLRSENGKWTFD